MRQEDRGMGRRRETHRRRGARTGLLVTLVLATAACSSGSDPVGQSGTTTTTAPETPRYYVSLGDSYAQGYQPGQPADDGFAYQVPELARAKGWDLELVNFGCGGATTLSLAEEVGCDEPARAPGGPVYDDVAQLDAAIAFVEEHPGEVAAVTVSIGGNDVTACAVAADPVGCVTTAVETLGEDLAPSLERLRDATGPDVAILGLTYPNVILGGWVRGSQQLAELSVIAFRDLINPALAEAYASIDATFVDVTEATGAYQPLTETTTLDPYGEIPEAVATVCELTWFCEEGDIHARTEGYRVIAELIVAALPDAP